MARDYDLIAIDFDGTLLGPDGKVSNATKLAVRRAVDAGYHVVFATGRNWYESLEVLEAVEHHATAVFVGGAVTVDLDTRQVIDRRTMAPDTAAAVVDLLDQRGLAPLILQDRELAGVDFLHGPRELSDAIRDWHRRHNLRVQAVASLADIDHTHTLRVGSIGERDRTATIQADIEAALPGRVHVNQVDLANYGVRLIEVFAPDVTKWSAIERVAAKHGIPAGRIVAVGDDMNDLQMLEHAGLGIAMGNAHPPVKSIADRVIDSNANDGLARFLDELPA